MIHSLPSSEPLTAQKLFSKLYVSYYARLVRFASLYVGAMGDAENIVQDFFLYLWERKEILPELQQPDAYLFSAVKHRCLNFLRSQLGISQNTVEGQMAIALKKLREELRHCLPLLLLLSV